MSAAKRQPATPRNFDPPPKVVEGMVQDIRGETRGRYRQTKSNPLRNYADNNQITEEQFLAGEWYERQYKSMYPGGRDSTDLDRVSGSGSGQLIADVQSDAIKKIIAVESRLSASDRAIVRKVCGDGEEATSAVRIVTRQQSERFPIPRFREALDNLVTAISRSLKNGWSVDMKPWEVG